MCGGKIDTSGQERAAREQAAELRAQSERERLSANEATQQSAAQQALIAQRSAVAAKIEETNAASKPEEAAVDLDTSAALTPSRKRAKFQLASDPSASIRI